MATTDTNTEPEDMMGYENLETAPTVTETTQTAETPQETLNRHMKEVKLDENGKYIYPDDIDPMLKLAMANAKSYRDNQSGFTKSQQSLKETEAEVTALRGKLAKFTSKSLELSREDRQELNELKESNPEEWRQKLNQLELEAKDTIKEELESATEEAREKASGEFELERRYAYLEQFNVGRKLQITPELLDSDVPPRITKKLAEGEVTFEEYLDEVDTYLSKGKTVSKTTQEVTTDLNQANGSSEAMEAGSNEDGIDYSSMTF